MAGPKIHEAELHSSSAQPDPLVENRHHRIGEQEEEDDDEYDLKFYEDIEAPKFVDFSVPDHYCPDDRYWFCMRVGCDQKHEEEMDSEKLYKDFVLRVMAARSPNVRLQKMLSRNASRSTKCPLSAPPKSSKPRLPRFPVIPSVPKRSLDDKAKGRSTHKLLSTPKIRGKQVAAKYLTTPRNRACPSSPKSFQSVQNPKTTTATATKDSKIVKALVFRSPKKGTKLKTSVELRTPLVKLCEGMKKLDIKSQKKHVLGSQKSEFQTGPKSLPANKDTTKAEVPLKSQTPGQKNKIPGSVKMEGCLTKARLVDVSDAIPLDGNSDFPLPDVEGESDPSSNSRKSDSKGDKDNENCDIEQQENMKPQSPNRNAEELPEENDAQDGDDKENTAASDQNRSSNSDCKPTAKQILGVQKKKAINKADINLKTGLASASAIAGGGKYQKPKPTHPKPFRLRTDERGILKEADFERKCILQNPQVGGKPQKFADIHEKQCNLGDSTLPEGYETKQIGASQNTSARRTRISNQKTPRGHSGLRSTTLMQYRCEASKCTKGNAVASTLVSDNEGQLAERSTPQGHLKSLASNSYLKPDQQLNVIAEGSETLGQKSARKLTSRAMDLSGKPSTGTPSSQKRKLVTIPKEPKFHSMHKPKGCSSTIALSKGAKIPQHA